MGLELRAGNRLEPAKLGDGQAAREQEVEFREESWEEIGASAKWPCPEAWRQSSPSNIG